MIRAEKQFNIGDTAFLARSGQDQIWITCPECLGSGRLRVILGDDSQVSIACVCCERGYEGSPGKIQTWAFRETVEEITITGVESELRNGDIFLTYKFHGCYTTDSTNLFATREDALPRAAQLTAEREAEEKRRLGYKEKQTKSWAWNVSYWRGIIRRAKKDIASAEARIAVAPKDIPKSQEAASCVAPF